VLAHDMGAKWLVPATVPLVVSVAVAAAVVAIVVAVVSVITFAVATVRLKIVDGAIEVEAVCFDVVARIVRAYVDAEAGHDRIWAGCFDSSQSVACGPTRRADYNSVTASHRARRPK